MCWREVHVNQHILFPRIREGGELGQLGSQLIGDFAPLRPGCFGIFLCEGGSDEGGSYAAALASGMRQQVLHEVDAAELPAGMQHFGDGER